MKAKIKQQITQCNLEGLGSLIILRGKLRTKFTRSWASIL